MRERPILFSAPMIRALLAGSKTQTRRTVKSFRHVLPANGVEHDCVKDVDGGPSRLDIAPRNWEVCPYGVPGDRLWVKETWRTRGDAPLSECAGPADIDYRADADEATDAIFRWRPSIFMSRWASRILLEVTKTRVQRLQAISAEDAIAEGLRWRDAIEAWTPGDDNWPTFTDPRRAYAGLWDHINGAGAWDANPWVWVVSFRVPAPVLSNG